MRKTILTMIALMAMTSCGNKTSSQASDADSTTVAEVAQTPDTLNTVEAVVKQVDAIYAYWNKQREHPDEDSISVDERFGTKDWWNLRQEVIAIDRECECGGYFDFGDEGPLDPWTYDCYEGYVSANDVEVKLLSEGEAEVNFLVKDAVTTKGVPMRWQMRVEDGQWRVANIIFVRNDHLDLYTDMRAYVDHQKAATSE